MDRPKGLPRKVRDGWMDRSFPEDGLYMYQKPALVGVEWLLGIVASSAMDPSQPWEFRIKPDDGSVGQYRHTGRAVTATEAMRRTECALETMDRHYMQSRY